MSKNRKNRKISKTKSLLIELSKIKSANIAITRLKLKFERISVEQNINKIMTNIIYKKYICDNAFPREYSEMESSFHIRKGNLDEEIWWNSIVLSNHSNELNEFIVLANKYFNLFSYGLYDEAMTYLLKIENEFGLSNWVIENKIILLSKKDGLKEQKEYLDYVRDKLPPSSSLLTYHTSQKVEGELSFEQYNRIFKIFWKDYLSIRNYFLLKCNPLVEKIDNLEDFIYDETKSPIIDRYLSLKKAFYIILSDENIYNLDLEKVKKYLKILGKDIIDSELNPLLYNLKIKSFLDLDIDNTLYVKALDYYTEGNYKRSHELCTKLLLEQSVYWLNIIELLVKCEIRDTFDSNIQSVLNENSIIYITYNCFKSILKKDKNLIGSAKKLLKIAIEFSSYMVSNNIVLFLHRQLPFFTPFPEEHSVIQAKLSSFLYDIRNRDLFNEQERINLVKEYSNKYSTSLTYKFIDSYLFNEKIPDYRKNKVMFSSSLKVLIDDDTKISIYNQIIKDGNLLDRFDATIQLTNLLFSLKRIQECIDCLVNGYFKNNNLIYSLPLKDIVEYISEYHKFDYNDDINIVILYDLFNRRVSSCFDEVKNIRYEIFLESQGFKKPSELIKSFAKYDTKKAIYFLEQICTLQTLDSSRHFHYTKDIETERINICQFLVENDYSNIEKLQKEIKNITESSLISKYIVEIEQNKIYVNEEGIKNQLSFVLMEYYHRYIDLAKNVGDLRSKLISIYIINTQFKKNNPYPENDIMNLLYAVLIELKDYFVFSSEYGLAGFLSTNIRHGKLYNFLSSSLVSSNLIIKNESNYWREYYKKEDEKAVSILHEYLKEFTSNIDAVINLFVNKYIQINVNDENSMYALFDYSFKKDITIPLFNEIEETPTFEDFQNRFFDIFWLKTKKNLEKIRFKIQNELSSELSNKFVKLNKDLETIKEQINISYIRDVVSREQIHMQRKIENILLWFTRQTTSNISDFDFQLPNNIVQEVINNVHINNKLNLYIDIQELTTFKGHMLKGFVDILFILYDNAINNYKKEQNKKLDRDFFLSFIKSEKKPYVFMLSVINHISENTNLDLLEQKIDEIKQNIKNKMYGHRVSSEGGTGFYKIVKILRYDLTLKNNFYFDFFVNKEEFKFQVEIHFGGHNGMFTCGR